MSPDSAFAPVELSVLYPQTPDSEDCHETLEIKEKTSAYYLHVFADGSYHAYERDNLEHRRRLLQKLSFSFFLFGLINNGELLMHPKYKTFLTYIYTYMQFSISSFFQLR